MFRKICCVCRHQYTNPLDGDVCEYIGTQIGLTTNNIFLVVKRMVLTTNVLIRIAIILIYLQRMFIQTKRGKT